MAVVLHQSCRTLSGLKRQASPVAPRSTSHPAPCPKHLQSRGWAMLPFPQASLYIIQAFQPMHSLDLLVLLSLSASWSLSLLFLSHSPHHLFHDPFQPGPFQMPLTVVLVLISIIKPFPLNHTLE